MGGDERGGAVSHEADWDEIVTSMLIGALNIARSRDWRVDTTHDAAGNTVYHLVDDVGDHFCDVGWDEVNHEWNTRWTRPRPSR